MAALPEELIEEILLKTPISSLVRFKTASKQWYFLISEDDLFAKRRLKQSSSTSSNNHLFLIKSREGVVILRSSDVNDEGSIRQLESGQEGTEGCITGLKIKPDAYAFEIKFPNEISTGRVVGSTNGLICVVAYGDGGVFLWNPVIDECKRILNSSTERFSITGCRFSLTGFAYDSYSDDYKIVGVFDFFFVIFSMKENSWRIYKYEDEHGDTCSLPIDATIFLNGAFHWCFNSKIVAFDLAKEKFFGMEIPVTTYNNFEVKLFYWLGSLCLVHKSFSVMKEFWVMKEYGIAKSWAKFATKHVELPLGNQRFIPVEYFIDSIPHKESIISHKYLIRKP